MKIAVLEKGSETETFLTPMGIEQSCTPYESTHEAFNSVLTGENDLVISNYAVGKALIGLYDLPMSEKSEKLHETNYYILYRQEDEELGAQVNALSKSCAATVRFPPSGKSGWTNTVPVLRWHSI